ncbi:hypothetical protein PMAYCL1PPCAC_31018, partial [Pristionchus mayeri]
SSFPSVSAIGLYSMLGLPNVPMPPPPSYFPPASAFNLAHIAELITVHTQLAASQQQQDASQQQQDASQQQQDSRQQQQENYFNVLMMTSPLGYDAIKSTLKSGAGKEVREEKTFRPGPYRDHTKNVVYNVKFNEHMAEIREMHPNLSEHQALVLRLRFIAEHVIRSLNEFG